MNAARRQFITRCAAASTITVFGPMLEACPKWPDNPLVFVDGGARWRAQLPKDFTHPYLSVGDGDSLGSSELDVVLDTSKDVSDLAYALDTLAECTCSSLELLGFLGGRRDHEWINFGEVAHFLSARTHVQVGFDREVVMLAPGKYTLRHQGEFSLVHFHDAHTSISGDVDFVLLPDPAIRAHSSHGLSNRASGTIAIETDAVALVFFNHVSP